MDGRAKVYLEVMNENLASALAWSVLDSLEEGVLVADALGDVLYSNKAVTQLLHLSASPHAVAVLLPVIAPQTTWPQLWSESTKLPLQFLTPEGTLRITIRPLPHPATELRQILLTPRHEPASLSQATIEQLTSLAHISREPDFQQKLNLIVDGLILSGWNQVTLTLRDAQFSPTHTITASVPESDTSCLQAHLQPSSFWNHLFHSQEGKQFRHGSCYFVPAESNWKPGHSIDLPQTGGTPGAWRHLWQPGDLLAVPLQDGNQQIVGLLTLDQPKNGRRPDPATLQTVELYAQFAASAIENARLVNETLLRSRELEILVNASNEFASVLDKDSVLSTLGAQLARVAQSNAYTIYQWQPDSNILTVLQDNAPIYGKGLPPGTPLTLSASDPIWQALQEQETVLFTLPDAASAHAPAWLDADSTYYVILLPLLLSGAPFGVTAVTTQHPPTASDLALLRTLASQGSKALETAYIFEETFARERFYNALGSVTLAINFTLDLEATLNLICSESQRIFNVDGSYIWLREGEQFIGRAARGHGEEIFKNQSVTPHEKDAFVNHIIARGQAIYVNQLPQHPSLRFKLPNRETIQAALGVPLEQNGNIVGVLVLIDRQNPFRFQAQDVSRATVFAAQAAIALKNAQLFTELRRLNEELDLRVAQRTQDLREESARVKILLRITSELSASLDQDRVLNQALHLVNEAVHATQGVILLIDQETGELIFRSAFGTTMQIPARGLRSGMNQREGLAGWVIENRSSVIVHDAHKDPRWVERPTSSEHRSVLAVPLMSGEDVIGVLMLFHTQPNAFTMQQLALVEAAAIQVANAINNANLYLLIRDQAERLGHTLHLEQIETAKNQAILESIADGVVVTDQHNQIILANAPATAILGIPKENLVGKPITEFTGLYGGQREDSWLETIKRWSKHAEQIQEWTYIDERLTFENKVVSVHLSPVLAGKQFFGTVSIFRDITKEVELDRLKSEFVSTVSHELRTPMTSIKGYVDLMLMGAAGQMSESQVRYLKVIRNNADRLHMLVNDLLDISRIETGKTQLDLRPTDISLLLEQVVEGHLRGRIQHEGKAITVHTDAPPTLPLVNIDRRRITQVLTNLLDNAFNYTPEHGEIRLTARENGRYVYISVQDTGIGIAPEDQKRIFDRFYRAQHEVVQRVPGTGLGLSIVNSLVQMHGGELHLESQPNVGSTFTFNLPIAAAPSRKK